MFNIVNERLISVAQSAHARRLQAEEDGQTLVEYGLILGLLGIAAVAAVTLLGGGITDMFQDAAGALGGPTTTA